MPKPNQKAPKPLLKELEDLEILFLEMQKYIGDYDNGELKDIISNIRKIQANIKQDYFTSDDIKDNLGNRNKTLRGIRKVESYLLI